MAVSLSDTLRRADLCFPGRSLGDLKLKARFMMQAHRHKDQLAPFWSPPEGSALAALMAQRPQTLGALIWPYQCAGWEAPERLTRIAGHCAMIDKLGAPWHFPLDQKLLLADMSAHYPDLQLILDQPRWFMREGGFVINLFVGDFRAFSLAFSLFETPEGRVQAVLGGLQGRNRDAALDLYRSLTKALHGLRPRDLLFDVFRMLCRAVSVDDILTVSQAHRHHQHPYFGKEDLTPNYDAIWNDRGGVAQDARFFRFSPDPDQRDLSTVKPKKRSLYRKRFAFLEDLESQLVQDLPHLKTVSFVDT